MFDQTWDEKPLKKNVGDGRETPGDYDQDYTPQLLRGVAYDSCSPKAGPISGYVSSGFEILSLVTGKKGRDNSNCHTAS